MADVSKKDMERIKEIYGLFKDKGAEGFDAFFLGPLLRALGLNPSCKFIEGLGGTAKPGGKVITLDEFVVAFTQARDNKDQGVYEDFIECLKLYDKLENGYMPAAELTHYLLNLGERLTPEECDEVCRDCMDEEDDDGNIPYIPFLARMCEKPVPKNVKPM
uniref:Uncharacterized protein n=2 Tax=Clastoptera arizonana TaxID=38151 RepID=A0A1B6D9L2_9HEMI